MTTATFSPALTALFEYLDNLTGRAEVTALEEKLRTINVTLDDVKPFVRFSGTEYLRNLIHQGEFFHALAICWRSGQRSPIHNHARSVCAVKVLRGTATETVFESTPSGLLKATRSNDLVEGSVMASLDDDTHQVSNLQAQGDDLVTLHVYSPPLLRMDTFSLTNPRVGEFRPMVLEQTLGSGI
ncbi:MAG: cysteine dioxygenase [Planctomycetota bacterium]|jgi:cysteine dioxygenase